MKISFERSGGIGGFHIRVVLDTKEMSRLEIRVVTNLIEKASFFALPSESKASTLADPFNYEITVQNGKQHIVKRYDDTIETQLRPLVEFLTNKARQKDKS
ncbi:protealysin inhibitor emfourin [Nitrososphaera viennensis]|uniref:Uncharacterized protein n=2 Tax=Nitrososphaera viennensis TaxID=1034015 RepID=A0A060HN80_9ARCH|nr:protealysin inhibitor emfourin [Nitrososphaera viennensis]AIC16635.1 hypothetical protein NVIE_023740 [Nitrososphaera viennensis EN76]UVS68560.1 hypothetical protein NWT39_11695 [Nitrososphaera viennensis]